MFFVGGGETKFPVVTFTIAPDGVLILPDVIGETAGAGGLFGIVPRYPNCCAANCGVVVEINCPFWKTWTVPDDVGAKLYWDVVGVRFWIALGEELI